MSSYLSLATGVAILAGSANATLFSFRSDDHHTPGDFTFFGTNDLITSSPSMPGVELLIDDNNGVLAPVVLDVTFEASFQITHAMSVSLGGGLFSHVYSFGGTFGFRDAAGALVLSATIDNGVFSALGTGSTWFPTATAMGTDGMADGATADVTYTWMGDTLADYGLRNGQSSTGHDDAAFTFTFINPVMASAITLDSQTFLPNADWESEGSYSGSANNFIPAPATAALALAGLVSAPRRRRTA